LHFQLFYGVVDWQRWQKEIDWMALNGINMPLALTGEEAIWQEVYRSMDFQRRSSIAFLAVRLIFLVVDGNIDAWGGPLPEHWKDSHKELQQKILHAERLLG